MDLTEKNKQHIDSLSYEQLLYKFRFAPIGDPWFQGETGDYWSARMKHLSNQPGGQASHVRVSENIEQDELVDKIHICKVE
jgi:hypothetical protein